LKQYTIFGQHTVFHPLVGTDVSHIQPLAFL
jgi:hypothetical protein